MTARHGSAANPVDVPIPERFKLDVKDAAFGQAFGERVREVFGNFDACSRELAGYREVIAQEPQAFRRQVAAAVRLEGAAA